jgi:tetratricopeptide (TPR) repeat protein
MKRSVLLIAALLAVTAPAHGDIWENATRPPNAVAMDLYTSLLQKGDDAALAAASQSVGPTTAVKMVDSAIEAYRGAANVNPKAAEPFYRIGTILNAFFFDDCDGSGFRIRVPPVTCTARFDRIEKAREMVAAWDRFEELAPLDPRINDLLVTRAITRTKLVGMSTTPIPLLEAAAKDYQAVLDREDGMLRERFSGGLGLLVLGNLAETHMMLGNIERAIEVYIDAQRMGARSSTMFGLAVALDRDDRGGDAFAVIRGLGEEQFEAFRTEWESGNVFFVPAGEEQYYFALASEALGHHGEAIDYWKAYLRSGAHPKYQPRAKEHLDRLLARKNLPQIKTPFSGDLGREPVLTPRSPFDPVAPPPPRPLRRPLKKLPVTP